MNIEEIVNTLLEAKEAYYNTNKPLLTDQDFDELEEKLKILDPNHEYFSLVGTTVSQNENLSQEQKIKHSIPMLSMDKAKNIESVEKWIKKLDLPENDQVFIVEPKIDGISATCMYQNSKLVYVATRGNGIEGQNITHIANYIDDIKNELSIKKKILGDNIEIRGELYLPKDTKYKTEGRPLRNICSGIINRKEKLKDLKYIRFVAYQIMGDSKLILENEKNVLLKQNHFHVVKTKLTKNSEEIKDYYESYLSKYRNAWLYETDGLIIMLNDSSLFGEIDSRWIVSHHHHYAIALKPPSFGKETKLKNIEWQVSRQGNAIPVAIFEKINIGGANLERATLNNFKNVQNLKLNIDDVLLVQRANDVIPFVKENISASKKHDSKDDSSKNKTSAKLIPKNCHSCKTKLVIKGVHLHCPNYACPEQIIARILFWVQKSEMENIAEASLRTLFNNNKIKSIEDLYHLKTEDFSELEGFAEKKINNFLAETKKSRKMSIQELIAKLGIPLVQKKALQKIGIYSIKDFLTFDDDSFVIGQNLIKWKKEENNLKLFQELVSILEIENIEKNNSSSEKKLKVCMTGKGPASRSNLLKQLESKGYEFVSSISKNLDILICENPDGKSTKLQKAKKLGIKIISYSDFFGN